MEEEEKEQSRDESLQWQDLRKQGIDYSPPPPPSSQKLCSSDMPDDAGARVSHKSPLLQWRTRPTTVRFTKFDCEMSAGPAPDHDRKHIMTLIPGS